MAFVALMTLVLLPTQDNPRADLRLTLRSIGTKMNILFVLFYNVGFCFCTHNEY